MTEQSTNRNGRRDRRGFMEALVRAGMIDGPPWARAVSLLLVIGYIVAGVIWFLASWELAFAFAMLVSVLHEVVRWAVTRRKRGAGRVGA